MCPCTRWGARSSCEQTPVTRSGAMWADARLAHLGCAERDGGYARRSTPTGTLGTTGFGPVYRALQTYDIRRVTYQPDLRPMRRVRDPRRRCRTPPAKTSVLDASSRMARGRSLTDIRLRGCGTDVMSGA